MPSDRIGFVGCAESSTSRSSSVEVHRQPSAGRYGVIERVGVEGAIVPAGFPALRIAGGEIVA